eukprot:SAG11_NODE_20836_length_437_cov_0.831361_1_plen_115_part_10
MTMLTIIVTYKLYLQQGQLCIHTSHPPRPVLNIGSIHSVHHRADHGASSHTQHADESIAIGTAIKSVHRETNIEVEPQDVDETLAKTSSEAIPCAYGPRWSEMPPHGQASRHVCV